MYLWQKWDYSMVLFVIVDGASEGVEGREGLDLVESDSSLIIKGIYY